jgi:hypothetical protein
MSIIVVLGFYSQFIPSRVAWTNNEVPSLSNGSIQVNSNPIAIYTAYQYGTTSVLKYVFETPIIVRGDYTIELKFLDLSAGDTVPYYGIFSVFIQFNYVE